MQAHADQTTERKYMKAVFSKIGILYGKTWCYDPQKKKGQFALIPLLDLESRGESSFVNLLKKPIEIEEDTSLTTLLSCLEPWQDIVSECVDIDFGAFLQEAHTPPSNPIGSHLSRIIIQSQMTLSNTHAKKFWKTPSTSSINIQWMMQVLDKTGNVIPVDHLPLWEWTHLPISIGQHMRILDRTNGKNPLFSQKSPPEHWVEGPTPNLFDTIISGVLSEIGTYGSPSERDRSYATLMKGI